MKIEEAAEQCKVRGYIKQTPGMDLIKKYGDLMYDAGVHEMEEDSPGRLKKADEFLAQIEGFNK